MTRRHALAALSLLFALARHVRQCALGVSVDGYVQTEVNIRTLHNWVPVRAPRGNGHLWCFAGLDEFQGVCDEVFQRLRE